MAHKNKQNLSPMKSKTGRHDRPSRRGHVKPTESYSFADADDRLRDFMERHGCPDLPTAVRTQFTEFYFLLMREQEHQNFTRLLKLKDIAIKHFVDCYLIGDLAQLQFPLLDIGTGPGFPGIPLKFRYPDQKIILAEGVQKRVEFLKHVRETMNLKHLDIIGRNINPFFFYPVQGVITRAVEDVSNTLGNVIHSLQTGGAVYFMKGPNVGPEIEIALKHWSHLYQLENDIAYTLPGTPHERRLVVFRKHAVTPLADLESLLAEEDRLAEEGHRS